MWSWPNRANRCTGATRAIGIAFILLGVILLLVSVYQYRRVVPTLGPGEISPSYWVNSGVMLNLALGEPGLVLAAYLALV